jgi:hypothetical protein
MTRDPQRAGDDLLTRIVVVVFVFPVCLVVCSLLVHVPLVLLVAATESRLLELASFVAAYAIGGLAAFRICRLAWPRGRSATPG